MKSSYQRLKEKYDRAMIYVAEYEETIEAITEIWYSDMEPQEKLNQMWLDLVGSPTRMRDLREKLKNGEKK